MSKKDDQIIRGFEAGNYANAYETTDYDRALARLSPNRSKEYVASFTLGFFSSYELGEVGVHSDALSDAYALAGERVEELGIAARGDDSEPDGGVHDDSYGIFGEVQW